jgi:hypothetical protein
VKQDKKLITVGIAPVFCTVLKIPEEACCNNKQIIDPFAIIHLVGHLINLRVNYADKKGKQRIATLGGKFLWTVSN